MRNDNKAELQHYVPKFLLRAHAREETDQVWCFDKSTDRIFSTNLGNVLAGTRFNEIEIDGDVVSLEPSLTKIEDEAAPVFARVAEGRSLRGLSDKDRQAIASFCSIQLVRTLGFRQKMKDTHEAIRDALKQRGIDVNDQPVLATPSDEENKLSALHMLVDALPTYGPHFLSKHWHLMAGAADDPYLLGDHPIVVDSNSLITIHDSTGIASPGVSIYLPLAPTLCLMMSDPAVIAELERGVEASDLNFRKLVKAMSCHELTPEIIARYKESKALRKSIESKVRPTVEGTPTPYNKQTTLRANSLQVINASRWIVSSRPDFATPKMMIADNEKFRTGPKVTVE